MYLHRYCSRFACIKGPSFMPTQHACGHAKGFVCDRSHTVPVCIYAHTFPSLVLACLLSLQQRSHRTHQALTSYTSSAYTQTHIDTHTHICKFTALVLACFLSLLATLTSYKSSLYTQTHTDKYRHIRTFTALVLACFLSY